MNAVSVAVTTHHPAWCLASSCYCQVAEGEHYEGAADQPSPPLRADVLFIPLGLIFVLMHTFPICWGDWLLVAHICISFLELPLT